MRQQADYVLALKGNQGNLHSDVAQLFDHAHQQDFCGIEHDYYETQRQSADQIDQTVSTIDRGDTTSI